LKDEIKKNEISVLNTGLENLDSEGYAGVALDFIESYIGGKEKEMVLIIQNNGSIDGIYDNDIIEVTCHVTKNSVTPIKIGRVPEIQMYLIRQVKLFERLASHAIRNRCMKTAISALMVHPLINSYTIAKQLVKEYVEKHSKYIGKWE
jgi:6-phospho-beta-glucosidase